MKSFIIFLLLFSFSANAEVQNLPENITPDNFDTEFERVKSQYNEIINSNPASLIRKFKRAKGNYHYRFTKKEVILKNDFKKLHKQKLILDPRANLRDELKNLYLEYFGASEKEQAEMHQEATYLAVTLFDETARLKKKYKLFPIPILHNSFINVGIKKRGACLHWAEDLLDFMRPIKRKYFTVTWGEAYPGTMLEHNVAVIMPKDRPFKDGLLFDPWRTGGKPYWAKVTEDPHYTWNQWSGYSRY